MNAAGEKLSKQTRAAAIDECDPAQMLVAALRFLGQAPPTGLADVGDVWRWAQRNWRLDQVPRTRTAPA